ncbi:hypothetical protein ACFL3V_07200 [Nanoarchaeota archaeon]
MDIQDVKERPNREKRLCRANIRLYPSQLKFINNHGLSIQRIIDKALEELGHVPPDPTEIEKLERFAEQNQKDKRTYRRRGKGNVPRQRSSARRRGKR